jgi:hypothetical protein
LRSPEARHQKKQKKEKFSHVPGIIAWMHGPPTRACNGPCARSSGLHVPYAILETVTKTIRDRSATS